MAHLKSAKAWNKKYNKGSTELYAKNLNLEVMRRILTVLVEQNPIKITNLAMFSRMNHVICKKYLQSMCKLGWIAFLSPDDYSLIKLTEMGIKIQVILDSLNYT